jgi:hypothetical protein
LLRFDLPPKKNDTHSRSEEKDHPDAMGNCLGLILLMLVFCGQSSKMSMIGSEWGEARQKVNIK